MVKRILSVVLLLCMSTFLSACGRSGGSNSAVARVDAPEIVEYQPNKEIKADIYLDGTYSMNGYVNFPDVTIYTEAVKGIERTITSVWNKDTVQYFKFGDSVRKLSRDEFLGFMKVGFYNQVDTSLQKVVERFSDNNMSIMVTDLFQTNQDIDSLIIAIKHKSIGDDRKALAIIGVKSEFDGKIYDIGKSQDTRRHVANKGEVDKYRPVYFVVMGPAEDVRTFAMNYKNYSGINANVKMCYFAKNIGHGELAADSTRVPGGKGDDAVAMAKVNDILGNDSAIAQYRLHYGKYCSKAAVVLKAEKVIGNYSGEYKLVLNKAEKWVPSLEEGEKHSTVNGKFKEIVGQNSIQGKNFQSKSGKDFELAFDMYVNSKMVQGTKGIYRAQLSLLPESEMYWGEDFGDWNFENGDNIEDVGSKTLNIKHFVQMIGNLNKRINKPGFYGLYVYFDVVK